MVGGAVRQLRVKRYWMAKGSMLLAVVNLLSCCLLKWLNDRCLCRENTKSWWLNFRHKTSVLLSGTDHTIWHSFHTLNLQVYGSFFGLMAI